MKSCLENSLHLHSIYCMKNTHVIIVADSGTLKAYRIAETSTLHRRKAELVKQIRYEAAHRKLSDTLSDRAGRFRGSGDARTNSKSSGEAHNLKSELKKKIVEHLAHDIEGVISHTPAEFYYISLPKPIHNIVLDEMKASLRKKITKDLAADLIKEPVDKIRARFKV